MDMEKGRWPVVIFDTDLRVDLDRTTTSDYYIRRRYFVLRDSKILTTART